MKHWELELRWLSLNFLHYLNCLHSRPSFLPQFRFSSWGGGSHVALQPSSHLRPKNGPEVRIDGGRRRGGEEEGKGRSAEQHLAVPSRISSHSSSPTLRMTRHCADSTALHCTALVSNHNTEPHQAWIGYSVESICCFSSSSYPIPSFCLHYFFKPLLVSKSEGTCFRTPTCGVEWIGLVWFVDGWVAG